MPTAAAVIMAAASANNNQRNRKKGKKGQGRHSHGDRHTMSGSPGTGRSSQSEQSEDAEPKGFFERMVSKTLDVLNSLALQTCLYLAFVMVFQMLANTLRLKQEYYMDKHIMDRFVENHFDSSHNTFESVRRLADIYEWGNNVMWPGFFADMGPCNSYVGLENAANVKGCNDDAWPDGEGSFHREGATPLDLNELVKRMDQLDWTEGITIRTARVAPQQCDGTYQIGHCYPELTFGAGSTLTYGFNHTHPHMPMLAPFTHFTAEELGANPNGVTSAAIPSMAQYEMAGFVAVVIPFFADAWIPEERDFVEYITDYRDYAVNTTNGKIPKYYCVRLSHNGRDVRQLCDPTTKPSTGDGEMTGVVRAAVEEMWNDLKRGHFLDALTRTMTITLQLKSNHLGIRYRITLMFEQTSLGAIFPSYDVETRIINDRNQADMMLYATISLITVLFFALLELIEVVRSGLTSYCSDLWNVMDWINFFFFFLTYMSIQEVNYSIHNRDCSSYLCSQVGHFDDYRLMGQYRETKQWLSLCLCIQLFKINKYLSQLIPKMGLMVNVLRACVVDLIFFGVVFFNALIAFSMMLYVQLGPVMEDFYANHHAAISLFRALFGDFDIDEIMDNSAGYTNAALFLGYLFVAIFICLSLFLAILAEAQGIVREAERQRKLDEPEFNEFGIVASAWHGVQYAGHRLMHPFGDGPQKDVPSQAGDEDDDDEDGPSIEEAVETLRGEVGAIGSAVKELATVVSELRTNPPEVLMAPLPSEGDAGFGSSNYGIGGGGIGVEEAKAMRMVVEALDNKLTRKLQQIDERLARRGAGGGAGGTKSRPTPQRGASAATLTADDVVPVAIATPISNGNGNGGSYGVTTNGTADSTFAC